MDMHALLYTLELKSRHDSTSWTKLHDYRPQRFIHFLLWGRNEFDSDLKALMTIHNHSSLAFATTTPPPSLQTPMRDHC